MPREHRAHLEDRLSIILDRLNHFPLCSLHSCRAARSCHDICATRTMSDRAVLVQAGAGGKGWITVSLAITATQVCRVTFEGKCSSKAKSVNLRVPQTSCKGFTQITSFTSSNDRKNPGITAHNWFP